MLKSSEWENSRLKIPILDLSLIKSGTRYKICKGRLTLYTTEIQKYRAGNQYKSTNNDQFFQMQSRQLEPNREAIYFILVHAQGLIFYACFQIVILPMKLFIKLSADKQVIVFKPGISSVIGIFARGSTCIYEAEQCQGKVLLEGIFRLGTRF